MRRVKKRSTQEIRDFQPDYFESLSVDGVGLGQHRDAAPDRQEPANVEVLARLRFDAFVRGNYQHHEVDATHSCQHVAHKTLVAGHIDKTETQDFAVWRGQFEVGKSDVDGDAAALFFFQAIGVNAGQGLYQRSFPVVDMAGGTYDDGFHREQYSGRRRMAG